MYSTTEEISEACTGQASGEEKRVSADEEQQLAGSKEEFEEEGGGGPSKAGRGEAMKIIVFGASGGTGRELVRQGTTMGHEVTAFVRNPQSIGGIPAIRAAVGDARDGDAVAAAVQGQDAVLSALGARSLRDSTLLPEAMTGILAGMQRHGVKRLIVLGAAGAWPGASSKVSIAGQAIVGMLGLTLLRHAFAAQRAMQKLIRTSDAEWTIVQPPLLLDEPGRGVYRVDGDGLPPRGMRIARGDVAAFMLAQLSSAEWVRKAPFVAW